MAQHRHEGVDAQAVDLAADPIALCRIEVEVRNTLLVDRRILVAIESPIRSWQIGAPARLQRERQPQPVRHLINEGSRKPPDPLSQRVSVDGDDLRDVGDRVARQA